MLEKFGQAIAGEQEGSTSLRIDILHILEMCALYLLLVLGQLLQVCQLIACATLGIYICPLYESYESYGFYDPVGNRGVTNTIPTGPDLCCTRLSFCALLFYAALYNPDPRRISVMFNQAIRIIHRRLSLFQILQRRTGHSSTDVVVIAVITQGPLTLFNHPNPSGSL